MVAWILFCLLAASATTWSVEAISSSLSSASNVNVVAVPHPCLAQSHVMSFLKIGRAVVDRGHHFTLVLSAVDTDVWDRDDNDDEDEDEKARTNMTLLTYPSLHDREGCIRVASEMANVDPLRALPVYINVGVTYCDALLSDMTVEASLRRIRIGAASSAGSDEAKDTRVVVLGDLTWSCSWLLAERLNATSVLYGGTMSLDPGAEHFGLPSPASEVPMMGLWNATMTREPMPFVHRLTNLVVREISRRLVSSIMWRPYDAVRKRYGMEPMRLTDAVREAANLILVPLVWGVEPPRSLPPNWKPIHPVLPGPAKPLDVDLHDFIDDRCVRDGRGLVVVSFGTQATPSEPLIERLYAAVSSLSDEFCFVWQMTRNVHRPDGLPSQSHVLPLEWLPQNDLLGQTLAPVVAFVSHVGYGSMYEAAYHGVPLVGIPLFGDQEDNAARAVYGGWGLSLNKDTFTADEMVEAIRKAGKEGSTMRLRAEAISALVKVQSGTYEAVRWIEYAVEYGVDHLVPFRSMKASYVAYYNLDVALFGVLFVLAVTYGMRLCFKRCTRRAYVSASPSKEKMS